MQKTNMPELNLTPTKVNKKVYYYHWPYSQPRIVNTIYASSKIGVLAGLLSCFFVLNNYYVINRMLFIDFSFIVSYLIVRGFIIPAIRRNKIKKVASESRKINYYGLIGFSIIMYSGLIRFVGYNINFFINNKITSSSELFSRYIKLLFINIDIPIIILGLTIVILPIILIKYPQDIDVATYHFALLNAQKQTLYYDAPKKSQAVVPSFSSHSGTAKYSTPIPNASKSNNVNTSRPKQEAKKDTSSVWETMKSNRKPRK